MLGSRRMDWMLHLTPASVGLFAAAMALAGALITRRWGGERYSSIPIGISPHRKFAKLRRSLLGSEKRQIASMLGPPQATQIGAGNTWYYPLSRREHLAIAISFERGVARQIEFVQSPA